MRTARDTRRVLREEILIVLSLSLLASAVFAVIDLFSAPIRGQTRAVFPQVGLATQLASITLGLAPVWRVIHLLRRSGEGVATIGLTGDRTGLAVVSGVALAVVVGAAGLALYPAAGAAGVHPAGGPAP